MADAEAGWTADRVLALKEARHWTWEEMASAVGVAWTTCYRWGAGFSTPSRLASAKLDALEREVA
jgi:DNA-binding XRE family transcriptional regulator